MDTGTPSELIDTAAMRARHVDGGPWYLGLHQCAYCKTPWPCDAIKALGALEHAEEVLQIAMSIASKLRAELVKAKGA